MSDPNASRDRVSTTVVIPGDQAMVALLGSRDELLRVLEQILDSDVHVRGNEITITGAAADNAIATRLIEQLLELVRAGETLTPDAVTRSHAMLTADSEARPADVLSLSILSRRGKTIRPKTLNQKRYVDAIDKHTIVFGIGPAGTGKTYLAVAKAVQALQAKQVNRIILTRPAVEAGERLGFLPGTLYDKIDPYLRPLLDALHDMVEPESIPRLTQAGTIEIAPLAYMRGRTLNDAFIILDEAQNTTPEQMKMFLTRLGFGSRMVITGDVTQVDLPGTSKSGLKVVRDILTDIDDVHFANLSSSDVVRHRLVGDIVDAYARYDEQTAPLRQPAPAGRAPRRATEPAGQQMSIEVNNESGVAVDERVLAELGRFVLDAMGVDPLGELSIVLLDTETMATMHQQWMDLPGPTDVMAFPMDGEDYAADGDRGAAGRPGHVGPEYGESPALLGDVVLCPEIAAEQAEQAGHSVEAELHLLCTHGILHLLGYDHAEPEEEREMFELQAKLVGEWAAATGRGPIMAPRPGTQARFATPPAARVADPAHRSGAGVTGPDIVATIFAIILVFLGGALACVDSALARVSVARVDEMVREGRRGAKRLSLIVADRVRYTNLLLLLRVTCELTATVLLTIVARSVFGSRWPVPVLTVALMVVVSYVIVGVGPRTLGRQHPYRVALVASGPVRLLGQVFGPLASLLILLGNAFTPGRGFRGGPVLVRGRAARTRRHGRAARRGRARRAADDPVGVRAG